MSIGQCVFDWMNLMKVQFGVDLKEEADTAHGRCICHLQIRVGN